jgi:hypothetical protein
VEVFKVLRSSPGELGRSARRRRRVASERGVRLIQNKFVRNNSCSENSRHKKCIWFAFLCRLGCLRHFRWDFNEATETSSSNADRLKHCLDSPRRIRSEGEKLKLIAN